MTTLFGSFVDVIKSARPTHCRDAPGAGQPPRRTRFRSRALHRVLPAQRVSRHSWATEPHLRRVAFAYGIARGQAKQEAEQILARETEIRKQLLQLRDQRVGGLRIRQHGDFQLSNLIYSGNDWIITNFEGDAYRSISERRIKRSALRDVASMLRSLHYVSHAALFGDVPGITPSREGHPAIEKWAHTWYRWISCIFLKEYLNSASGADFLPAHAHKRSASCLVPICWNVRCMEIEHELQYRPQWIRIPLHGILEHLNSE